MKIALIIYTKKHLKISRQRKDWACKLARCVIESHDLVVYEDLKIRNLVRNHHLAKSISDAAWYQFTEWLEYFARISAVPIVAIPPHFTSQDCPKCGYRSKKTLSTRTHRCSQCGHEEHRDTAAAKVILARGLEFLGETVPRGTGNLESEMT